MISVFELWALFEYHKIFKIFSMLYADDIPVISLVEFPQQELFASWHCLTAHDILPVNMHAGATDVGR